MGSLSSFLFGGADAVTLPTPIMMSPVMKQAQMVQFGQDRTNLMNNISGMYDTSRTGYNTAMGNLPSQIDTMGGQLNDISGQMGGNANQLSAMGGYNPYNNYYENPAAVYQQDQAARNAAINAAYGNYGSLGGQYQQQSGLMSSDAARRGITNSGYARRMQEDLAGRKAAAEGEARNKGINESNAYLINAGNLYNQGRQLGGNQISQAAAIQNQRASLAQAVPQMYMSYADMGGKYAVQTGEQLGKGQSEARNAQQAIDNYNTELYNNTWQKDIQNLNNRNTNQAQLDANRQRIGIIPTAMNAFGIASNALSGFKGFGSSDCNKGVDC